MSQRRPGQVIGRPGGGLEAGRNQWAANADVARQGHAGELRTAAVLDPIARTPGGPTVLHDLTIPGSRANIDHALVRGSDVLLIDSKQWKPGRYWTLPGLGTFRGRERFSYADKATMAMAVDKVRTHLEANGVQARVLTPLVVIWPSSKRGTVRTLFLRIPCARVIAGDSLARAVGTGRAADPQVVAALAKLLPAHRPVRTASPAPTDTW
ncbi:nuclease-related domain-containing protein [Pseudactinotalea terrae]|uniref:nuclease-related domain-containing protein n=1 Tax=Pseudactinotalea terrae TaxID=1743262 RepID=UPI0013915D5F|nr:nuclease-related domain-containing protein [Pseudactinotalea terrae]